MTIIIQSSYTLTKIPIDYIQDGSLEGVLHHRASFNIYRIETQAVSI